jgi:DNA-binding response OmpR family regulator
MDPVSLAGEAAKILIVDDNPRNLQLLSMLLRPVGYRIIAAQDGAQALKAAEKSGPALILLDVMMPGLDGFEVCRRLKAESRTREIPVIFLTARTETADLIRGFEMGAADYVTKPFTGVELLARVRTHLAMVQRVRLQGVLEMAGAVCHELHQPMQAVLGLAEMLARETDAAGVSSNLRERAVAIQKEVLRMRGITNKLTRITRYETRDYLSGRIVDLDRSASAANADSTGPGGKK